MIPTPGFDFLRVATHARLFVIGNRVLASPSCQLDEPLCDLTSLAAAAAAFQHRGRSGSGAWVHPSTLAMAVALRLDELNFCGAELIPFLAGVADPSTSPPGIADVLRRLASEFPRTAEAPPRPASCMGRSAVLGDVQAALLARSLNAPCVIVGGNVIPLRPIRAKAEGPPHVIVLNVGYRFELHRICRLEPLVARARQSLEQLTRRLPQPIAAPERPTGVRDRLVEEALAGCPRGSGDPMDIVLYQDPVHQLRFSHGEILLIRKCLSAIPPQRTLYAVLPIRGVSRAQRLAVVPRLVNDVDAAGWSMRAMAARPPCFGRLAQYRGLQSAPFSDAEAVAHWLDALVILATGRPGMHRATRNPRRAAVRR